MEKKWLGNLKLNMEQKWLGNQKKSEMDQTGLGN